MSNAVGATLAVARRAYHRATKQAVPEASEEVNTTLANTAADLFIMGDKSQYLTEKRQYMAQGMTAAQAEKQAGSDWFRGLMADALGGAISGGLFATGATAVNGFRSNRSGNVSQQIHMDTQGSGTNAGNGGSQSDTKMQQTQRENNSAQAATATNRKKIIADTTRFDGSILANLNKAREYFIDYAHKNFPSYVVNADTGKSIGISRNGLDKFLSGRIGREKYASGFHIPELIEQAYKVAEAKNYHEVQSESIPTYEYYDSPIEIDGKNYTAHIRVRNTLSGDRYYGHTISRMVDEIEIEPSARASVSGSPGVQSVNAIDDSMYIIPLLDQNVNEDQAQKAESGVVGGKRTVLPAVQDLSSETLREWLQAAGHTGDSLSALQDLYIQNGMAAEKASRTVLQNLLNRYAGAFRNGTDRVTAQAIAEAAEKDRLERTVVGENARYNGTAEALVEAALQLPRDTEARNLADQATIARQAEILGKLEELDAAKKQAGGIQTSEQLQTFMKTVGRLEQELEALEQGKLSDRLDSETLGRLAEAVEDGQKLQLAAAWENDKLTGEGNDGNVNVNKDNPTKAFGNIFENGVADKNRLKENALVFSGKNVEEINEYLTSLGYITRIDVSSHKGSNAKIIRISNDNSIHNISQVQISPGGRRHGLNPYLKFSTTNQGIIKIVFGDPSTYKTDGKEKAFIIFAEADEYD